MYLNAGSFMKLLELLKPCSVTQSRLYDRLFCCIDPDQNVSYIPSNIKAGRNEIPSDVREAIVQIELHQEQLIRFRNEVIPFFEENLKTLVAALLLILKKDKTIDDTVRIDSKTIGEWEQCQNAICADSFIFGVMVFAFQRNNKNEKASEGINDRFIELARKVGKKIQLTTSVTVEPLAIDVPAKARFQAVFHEIPIIQQTEDINVRLFHLEKENNKFSYAGLVEYFRQNLFRYVHTRLETNGYSKDRNNAGLHLDARTKLQERYTDSSTKVLDSLMVEACLCDATGAPKVVNILEHDTRGIPSGSHGIHYMKSKSGKAYQLLIAVSVMANDGQAAAERAFDDIRKIISNGQVWKTRLFCQSALLTKMPEDDARLLAEIVIPKQSASSGTHTGYGIFIGYRHSLSENTESSKIALYEEIKHIMPVITEQIASLNLKETSFYVFFVPFNDAEEDKEKIIRGIIR